MSLDQFEDPVCDSKVGSYLIVFLLLFQEITFPKMVANCCRFLCYFCRISRQNQKAMFDHLSYLLENSSVGLGQCVQLFFVLFKHYSCLTCVNSTLLFNA